jgi:hypothetical protein
MKRLTGLLVSIFALALLGAPALASASPACPPGHSQMGCSLPPVVKGISTPPKGEIVPDVSSYQQTVNWTAVKAWQLSLGWKLTGGIFKLGENVIDPYALQNARGLRAAGMEAVAYVFVRPGVQASTVIGWARAAGVKVLVLDEEVLGIQGTAARIAPALKAAGLTVVDYHSQGNVLDATARGLPCWVADYGPRFPPVCSTCQTIAWQFTDLGRIPGISGTVDESVSYGLLKLAVPPKPPRLICFGRHATPRAARCAPVLKRYRELVTQAKSLQAQATALQRKYS